MLTALRFQELRLARILLSNGGGGLITCELSTERLSWVVRGVPVAGTAVAVCISARSWELGWFADSGTVLAAITYSLEDEVCDTEYLLALVPKSGDSDDFGLRDVLLPVTRFP